VRRAPALGDSVAQIVKGWLGVHKFLGSDGEPKTESEARPLACATKSEFGFLAAAPEPNCSDAPPWIMKLLRGLRAFFWLST